MTDNNIGLDYNTSREKMAMPEYGRNVLRMVESLRLIEDKAKRSEQARAIIKVMEILFMVLYCFISILINYTLV